MFCEKQLGVGELGRRDRFHTGSLYVYDICPDKKIRYEAIAGNISKDLKKSYYKKQILNFGMQNILVSYQRSNYSE